MAITITQHPDTIFSATPVFVPAFNPQVFSAISNQYASANFKYTVVVVDVITSETITLQIPARPVDHRMTVDASFIAKNLITHYLPINEYGFQKATGIRKIRVNIGETYGSTPTYYAGTDFDYYIWNGVSDYLTYVDYNKNNYLYNASVTSPPNRVELSACLDDVTYPDRSNYIYWLTYGAGDLLKLKVVVTLSNGTQTISYIANPYQASTTYTDKYLCIDVGHKGLTEIASGDVTGTYPILGATAESYQIYEVLSTAPDPPTRLIQNFTIGCEGVYDVYTVHFLAKNGQFETIHFPKNSNKTTTANREKFATIPFTMNSGTYHYSRSTPVDRFITSSSRDKLVLRTDWLDEAHVELYKQIIDSPLCYLDTGSALDYVAVNLVPTSYTENKRFNKRLFQLQMEFEMAHQNYRQSAW